jgi:hypothetical protein
LFDIDRVNRLTGVIAAGTTTAGLVFARDVLLRPSPGLDCALSGLDPIAVEGQLLVCTWDGTIYSEIEAVALSAYTAKSLLAVGVVLIYNFNMTITPQNAVYFNGFPGLSISGADTINVSICFSFHLVCSKSR